ncbi:MAG: DUF935 domain-containing protein [Desulfarculales bacterium]|jgi:phage gp29-like protein|nr:DUF935 domain-containing protein [Desulfarculales bacterium]
MPDAKGIYLANGDFKPFAMESLTSEIATRQNAGASLSDLGLWLSQLPDPDPVLRKRGDDARVLAELYSDDQVTTATLSRKNRVLSAAQYGFRPGGPDGEPVTREAQNVYDRLMQDLERLSLRPLISSILDAPFYGLAVLELIWAPGNDGWWHFIDIVARPYHWFAFDNNNQLFFRGEAGLEPKSLPAGKFVLVSHHASYDNPYGLRLLSRCLWPVAFKRGGLQFYAKFVERHGLPWVVGKAPKGASGQDKREMAAHMARMVQDCVAVLPAGAEIEFLAMTGNQDQVHERFLARQDKAISKLLMGQTLTVEMEGRNNSQAAAATHEDVAEGLAEADKAMVADAMNEIAWLYTQVNAGRGVFAPLFSYEEPQDLQGRAELDKKLYEIGVDFTAEHFQENYNLKPSEFTLRPKQEAGFPAQFSAAAPAKSAFLAEEAQGRLDAAIKQIMPEALQANAKFVTQLENAVKRAQNLDELELLLADLLASRAASPSEIEDLLARTMTAAAGMGAAAVQAEAKEDK